MNILIKLTIGIFAVCVAKVGAQEFQGEATYRSKRQVNIEVDSTKVSSSTHQQMMELLKKQFQKTYTLTFNKNESVYKEEETLSTPQLGGNLGVMVMANSGSDILYKNTKANRYTNQNDVFGKIFLIKDSIQKRDWKLESETKNIGEYTCYKATITREVEVMSSGISINGDKDLSKDEPTTRTQVITAWYTTQIPVNNGPENYQGLPGLILEVNDGSQTLICSKIVLNPEKRIEIKEPTKGKEVDQEQFDVIMAKKRKEMMERYSPRNNRDGETFQIRIGG
ncbi:GLPGLI family protein [uncultured Psychroserpens sp.]|uniref:GLPGLI family protein n=1 Tax=uncultured Psychroserpens sp. TaxID=255436 RepID=UPI00261D6548|nr:GLPGLI family protein [uncultured Psychroserpens sp.]